MQLSVITSDMSFIRYFRARLGVCQEGALGFMYTAPFI